MDIKQHDVTGHLGGARLELIEIAHHNHARRESRGIRGGRRTQRNQMQALTQAGRPARILDQLGLFFAAHPMRHLRGLQRDLGAERAHGVGDLDYRGLELR